MTSTWLPLYAGLIPGALLALGGHCFFVWSRRLALIQANILGWVFLLLLVTLGGIVLHMGLSLLSDPSFSYQAPSAMESGALILMAVALILFLGGVHAYGSRISFLQITGAIGLEVVGVPFFGYCFQEAFVRSVSAVKGSSHIGTFTTGLGITLLLLLLFRVGDRSILLEP